ncbi:uncharacterized protein LOC114164616 [Vigna unguiculata]|uniref:DUF241 domain protein n=1 Tax=Vigna unguiculata TaxID=3917 RepID=A0A4D6NT38_VIGUN|nr:uncharacterized protein LOC114164616 [Vigna unguiculata]QCE16826.1 hypothetical protein DEO72_LG11g3845 [Vigna unguiculata]
MAVTEINTKSSLHTRSNSFPSAPHPVISQYEEHLQRLKDCEAASSLSHKLDGLLDLHDCTDKLLHLTSKQQVLARECSDKCVDGLLEGSLRLLDICSTAKECLLISKESLHELHSVIRRRKGDETVCTIEGGKYLASRNKLKKAIRKALRNLKAIKSESALFPSNKVLSILTEAEEITMKSLESLLVFICDPKGQPKQSKWSAISKLMQPKRVSCDSQESKTNEFETVDATLLSLLRHKSSSMVYLQSHLENLEICIQDLELGVEHLSRKLIRNRVSLLNIFNH